MSRSRWTRRHSAHSTRAQRARCGCISRGSPACSNPRDADRGDTVIDCPREQDILEAVAAGHWPQGCDAELRAHVEACPACADLATVAGALHEERQHAWQEARVPSAARVW